ncbi:hypothetical protein [Streptomyces melanogenes]|uniref:hypothetical protein n=1 Tax=Streptomyces melanogenes TaxID=67326 RepID=UPI00167EB2A7|nr:hypothetical protein [Streptomyces melanogenes]
MRSLTAKILDRLILLAASICMVARQYDFPDRKFWTDLSDGRPFVIVTLICIIGIFGAFTPFQALSERKRVERRSAIRQEILTHYGKMLCLAVRAQPPVELQDLGLHIWRIRRSLRHPVHGYLQRVATYRLGSTPTTRTFAPPKGVGVVGLCWKRNSEVSMDVEKLAADLSDQEKFEAYRAAHGAEAVMGFDWAEFQRVRHRGAVFAGPIRGGTGTFRGCVSVDASRGHDSLAVRALWDEINSLCSRLGHGGLDDI